MFAFAPPACGDSSTARLSKGRQESHHASVKNESHCHHAARKRGVVHGMRRGRASLLAYDDDRVLSAASLKSFSFSFWFGAWAGYLARSCAFFNAFCARARNIVDDDIDVDLDDPIQSTVTFLL
jgi:hypothetical protein